MEAREVAVPAARWARWRENFETSHGSTSVAIVDGALRGEAADGSTFEARAPLGRPWDDAALRPVGPWGLLLVRKGGFAVVRLDGTTVVEQKVGRRHVQGRTKAGGQSQQRFARRRDNQARAAYDAASDHAVRILGNGVRSVVTGGDRAAVRAVLADRRLAGLEVSDPWLAVPDPRASVVADAVAEASSLRVTIHDPA